MFTDIVTSLSNQLHLLAQAAISLPVAAVLCAVLAFRPRRLGTPIRDPEVIHTQIILGVIGALLMLVVGESLARAFGIVGAAGLIRYRAKIKDPKDAGVMLATLGLGLASGVGLYLIAVFATLFLLVVLWFIESHRPKDPVLYKLTVSTPDPMKLRPTIEDILHGYKLSYEMLDISDSKIDFELLIVDNDSAEAVSDSLQKLASTDDESFTWKLKKAD